MGMTLEEFRERYPARPEPVPVEYSGHWVAWNPERTRIVAHAITLEDVCTAARLAGYSRQVLHKIPPDRLWGDHESRLHGAPLSRARIRGR